MKKYLSIKHYVVLLRQQPKHMQHLYAVLFSAFVTGLLACVILYKDYGFWHERYKRNDPLEVKDVGDQMVDVKSPGEMLSGFFDEVSKNLEAIKTSTTSVFDGKEQYKREEVEVIESTQ